MATEFKLPDLGENIETGDVISVLVKEGDEIQAEQGVVEVETGKAVVEVPCPHAGRVVKVHIKKGDKVPVGATLLTLESNGAGTAKKSEPASQTAAKGPATAPPPEQDVEDDSDAAEEPAPQPGRKPAAQAQSANDRKTPAKSESAPSRTPKEDIRTAPTKAAAPSAEVSSNRSSAPAGPATRRLARELGVDLARVDGSGPGGRITRDDIIAAVRELNAGGGTAADATEEDADSDHDAWGSIRREPLTAIRRTIAAHMARSASTIPHVTNFDDADITELERIRKGSMADYAGKNVKLTSTAFVLKSVAHALKLHPAINASLDLEHEQVIYKDYVNLGVAVDTERGLVVPVLRDVDRMTIPQIAAALTNLAAKARGSQFSLDDLRGGTFTISNLGAIGGTYSTPIINYPEVAILLIGRSRQLPLVVNDKVEVRLVMPLSLSYDHRWVDGAVAARFLNEVKAYLESPARLLLAP